MYKQKKTIVEDKYVGFRAGESMLPRTGSCVCLTGTVGSMVAHR